MSDVIDVNIDVSQAHLEAGIPGQWEACALALAINDRFPGCRPTVGPHTVVCFPKGKRVRMHMTASSFDFVADFDHKRRLAPTSVPLQVDPETLALLEAS